MSRFSLEMPVSYLVNIKASGPGIVCNLAQTGINDMDYPLSIVLFDGIREPYSCTCLRKPDQGFELPGGNGNRLVLFSNPPELEVIADKCVFCLSGQYGETGSFRVCDILAEKRGLDIRHYRFSAAPLCIHQ